ncbi:hypothetical protein A0H76_511 [Hepatospora eriocheir]|uniref:DNA-directed RNA polymerase RBP11-like dimerisation domain-containing protein n=1 Tax=Hepatospora eriocheir TaxID=1081669 RepID=A0A1X0QLA2_9MICR|nr:hypothetical protein HERIO_310 [Hepatospora eriocheir]ORE00495.1 hypothetical protein A0H76_511 [Hepatospora eriocheir]
MIEEQCDKVEIKQLGKNYIDVIIHGEDYTVACPIAERLLNTTEYCAFNKSYPDDKHISIRLKTNEVDVKNVFKDSVKSIIDDIDSVIDQIK